MGLTATELISATALSWRFLNVGKNFKNIFTGVASIFVKCVVMVYCGDSASVGLSFYFFHFLVLVSICCELIVSGLMIFFIFLKFFFNTADKKVFGIIGWP